MGKSQPDDIIILQMWITAKFGNTKLEKLILHILQKNEFWLWRWFFSLVIYVTITFVFSKLNFT